MLRMSKLSIQIEHPWKGDLGSVSLYLLPSLCDSLKDSEMTVSEHKKIKRNM